MAAVSGAQHTRLSERAQMYELKNVGLVCAARHWPKGDCVHPRFHCFFRELFLIVSEPLREVQDIVGAPSKVGEIQVEVNPDICA
jgi:hypothetical protein